MALATGSTVLWPKPPEQTSGTRRHQLASSSPSSKGDRDTQHAKKKVRAMDLNQPEGMEGVLIGDTTNMATTEEINMDDSYMKNPPENENVWTQRTNKLFHELSNQDEWYVADSEDIASAMREEDDVLDEEEIDSLCPPILFTTTEKTSFRRAWWSALMVKGLGCKVPYLSLASRLNYLWARNGPLLISDLRNDCFLVRFRCREDYDLAISGGPWMLGDTYLTVHHN
ncbi:hypothetical protein LINGRAHAP2_LOCUS2722 [Linum grandiflorum]